MTYPDSKYVDYTYLADGSMSTVTDWLSKQTMYTYDDAGRLTKTQYPNTVWTDYAYDSADRLLSVINQKTGPVTISSYTYSTDAVGNRTQMIDLSGTHTYQYDALNQLKQVTYAGPQTDTYTYDANGNRLTKNATSYTNDAADQMTAAGGTSYVYDNEGNQTSRGSDTLSYDHENQLTKITLPNTVAPEEPCYDFNGSGFVDIFDIGELTGSRWGSHVGDPNYDSFYDLNNDGYIDNFDVSPVSSQYGKPCTSKFTYSGDGLRVARAGSYLNWKYVWDAATALPVILKETDSHNALDGHGTDNTYVYGLDLISVTDRTGAQSYFLSDGLGSTTGLSDGSGNTTATYTYDVFGAVRSQTGPSKTEFQFAGEQFDPQGSRNFAYLRERYYDPATGRFLSRDPAESAHPYAYVENNPVRFTDPSGMCILGLPCPSREQALTAVRVGLSVTPVIGDVNDAIAVATGYDIIWGEKLGMEERALTAAGLFIGSGRMWREAGGLGLMAARGDDAGNIIRRVAQRESDQGMGYLRGFMRPAERRVYDANPEGGSRFLGTAVHRATDAALRAEYGTRFRYRTKGVDFVDTTTGEMIELTTLGGKFAHDMRPGYFGATYAIYRLPRW